MRTARPRDDRFEDELERRTLVSEQRWIGLEAITIALFLQTTADDLDHARPVREYAPGTSGPTPHE